MCMYIRHGSGHPSDIVNARGMDIVSCRICLRNTTTQFAMLCNHNFSNYI